jgi:hypothetical protein
VPQGKPWVSIKRKRGLAINHNGLTEKFALSLQHPAETKVEMQKPSRTADQF